jgi:hypothetical protein
MAETARLGRAATYADVCRVPDHVVAETPDGELWTTPRQALSHAHVTLVLAIEIGVPIGLLCDVSHRRLRPLRGGLTAAQKSADGVVGHDVGKASEALQQPKGGATDRPNGNGA